jgi:integrase
MPEDSQKLLAYSREHYLGPAIHLQILAGLRPSEVQALRWGSVDFERGVILIRAAYNNKERRLQEHPKQDDWGLAPIPPQLRSYLMTQLKAQRQAGEDGFVAQSETGEMLPYGTYLQALRRACREAGVPEVTPHELRHSCTELYVQAGATAEDIRRLLNQSSLTATARYMHRTEARLNSIAERVGAPASESSSQIVPQTQKVRRTGPRSPKTKSPNTVKCRAF